MGLAERRAVKDYHDTAVPQRGTPALQHAAHANVESVADRTKGIITTLEHNS
jgi:hypothetical protein